MNLLQTMSSKWNSAKHCYKVLEILRENLVSQSEEDTTILRQIPSTRGPQISSSEGSTQHTFRPDSLQDRRRGHKRQRVGNRDFSTSNETWHTGEDYQGHIRHNQNPHRHIEPAFNEILGDSAMFEIDKINEMEWPDVFGQVSWESLFHDNSNSLGGIPNFPP